MPEPEIRVHRESETLFLGTRSGIEVCRASVGVGPGVWEFFSTVTQPGYEGKGYAAAVVEYALDAAADAGVKVIPSCWYVDGFMDRRSPKYDHLRSGPSESARAADPACRIAPTVVGKSLHRS